MTRAGETDPVMNRRVVAASRGGPEILQIVKEPRPAPSPGEARVRIIATGVSYADLLMREGVHPETPQGTITLGWDLVGTVDALGPDTKGFEIGQMVAALPVLGGYADYICLRPDQLVNVPEGLDPAEAVAMVLNYVTAYQMMHRTAKVRQGQRILIHGAAGGIGTALMQLGRFAGLEMYGTASQDQHETVTNHGATPIDYKNSDFVSETMRLTGDGVDVVFDGIGGGHVWQSYKALRRGGQVVAFGLTASLRKGRLAGGLRHRFRGQFTIGRYMVASRLLPGGRRIHLYSIQRRMWAHPDDFREDLTELFRLLQTGKIKPLIAARLPLGEFRKAHEMLAEGNVSGKIILLCGETNIRHQAQSG
jgi:NADPH:quinone reductase